MRNQFTQSVSSFKKHEIERETQVQNEKLMIKLFQIQKGKHLSINVDIGSIAPHGYNAGGFTRSLKSSELLKSQHLQRVQVSKALLSMNPMSEIFSSSMRENGADYLSSNLKVKKFPNGKVIESFFPKITKNEIKRREMAKSIEVQNIQMAKRLVSQKPNVPDFVGTMKHFCEHQKVKKLRCHFPLVNMSNNSFNPRYCHNYSQRMNKNESLTRNSNDLKVVENIDSKFQTKAAWGKSLNDQSLVGRI